MSGNVRNRRRVVSDTRALAVLISHPTVAAAAEAAGCSERTLRRRLDEPTFLARYERAVERIADQSGREVVSTRAEAITRLRGLLQSESESTALRAIVVVLRDLPSSREKRLASEDEAAVVPARTPSEILGLSADLDAPTVLALVRELHGRRSESDDAAR